MANSQRKKDNRLPGAGGGGEYGKIANCIIATEFLFGMVKTFWKQVVAMAAQYNTCN